MGKQQRTYTAEWLKEYSGEHLYYEIDMFFSTADLLSGSMQLASPPMVPEPERMAVLESFTIHTRNLIEFLFSDSPRPTDVVALDFFQNSIRPSIFPAITPELKELRGRANREVGHLTSHRISGRPQEKEWDVNETILMMRPALLSFVRHADPGCLHPVVASYELTPAPTIRVGASSHSTASCVSQTIMFSGDKKTP